MANAPISRAAASAVKSAPTPLWTLVIRVAPCVMAAEVPPSLRPTFGERPLSRPACARQFAANAGQTAISRGLPPPAG
jgi:hypothetical protein